MKKSLFIKILAMILSMCSIACFLVACGGSSSKDEEEHKHSYTKEVVEDKFFAFEADCENGERYYLSCKCGKKGSKTFEVGEPLGHDYSSYITGENNTHVLVCGYNPEHTLVEECYGDDNATCSNFGYCTICNCSYLDVDNHVFNQEIVDEQYKASEATCVQPAQYYYTCECGAVGMETFGVGDTIPHTYDQMVESDDFAETFADCRTQGIYYYSCVCGAADFSGSTFVGDYGTHRIYSSSDEYYTITNDEAYPFEIVDGKITSTNHDHNSSSTYKFTAERRLSLYIIYYVSSEGSCDRLTIYKNGEQINSVSGLTNGEYELYLAKGDIVEFIYSKDGSVNSGDDCAMFTISSSAYVQVEDPLALEPHCENYINCEVCGEVLVEPKGHDYTEEIVESDRLAAYATCQSPILYYKSCACGAISSSETFEYGECIGHTFDQCYVGEIYKATDATCLSPATYYFTCKCGEIGTRTFEYGDVVSHIYDQMIESDEFAQVLADCQTEGVYYYSCECGAVDKTGSTFTGGLGNHKIENLYYTTVNDRYHPFTIEGDYIISTNHNSSSTSSYTINVLKDMSFELEYKTISESGFDKFKIYLNDIFVEEFSGEMYNYNSYVLDVVAGDVINLSYSKDGSVDREEDCVFIKLPKAVTKESMDTSLVPCENDLYCVVCDQIILEATGHDYSCEIAEEQYLVSEATCSSPAVYYKSCRCGLIGSETFEYGDMLEHSYEFWNYDEEGHWRYVSCGCDVESNSEAHVEDENGYCAICGMTMTAEEIIKGTAAARIAKLGYDVQLASGGEAIMANLETLDALEMFFAIKVEDLSQVEEVVATWEMQMQEEMEEYIEDDDYKGAAVIERTNIVRIGKWCILTSDVNALNAFLGLN